MARVETGSYTILFYDEYGAKVRDATVQAICYTEATEIGKARVKASDNLKSFTIDRRLYNSLDCQRFKEPA